MSEDDTQKRLVKFLSVDKRRSCNAFRFKDMVTGEIIEVTAKGLQQLLQDLGLIGLELREPPRKSPTNAKRLSSYYTVVSTSLGEGKHGQGKIIPTRTDGRDDRD